MKKENYTTTQKDFVSEVRSKLKPYTIPFLKVRISPTDKLESL